MEQKYYCKVDGGGAPRKPHLSIEVAMAEAARLHAQANGARRVEVLQVVAAVESIPGAIERAPQERTTAPTKQPAKTPTVIVKKARRVVVR